jgi:hypothetical protein
MSVFRRGAYGHVTTRRRTGAVQFIYLDPRRGALGGAGLAGSRHYWIRSQPT